MGMDMPIISRNGNLEYTTVDRECEFFANPVFSNRYTAYLWMIESTFFDTYI